MAEDTWRWLNKAFALAWVFQTTYVIWYYKSYIQSAKKRFWLSRILLPRGEEPRKQLFLLLLLNVALAACAIALELL